jgi:lysozyme
MLPSDKCHQVIKSFEGLSLNAYPDPGTGGEPFTIGYGTTVYKNGDKVKLGDTISHEQAEDELNFEIDKKSLAVDTLTKSVSLNQNQFDALTSFAYNCGIGAFQKSTLLKRVLANPQDADIRNQFMKWNKSGGQEMKGLTRRRTAEAGLYFS